VTSDWSPDTDEGGTIWTSGRVQELIEEKRFQDESPNQCLKRVLGDGDDRREVDQERIREIAREEIEKEKRRSR